jgi:hypothetical protein
MARIIGTNADEILEQGTEEDDLFYGKGGYEELYTFGGDDIVLVTPGNGVDHIEDLDPFHASRGLNSEQEAGTRSAASQDVFHMIGLHHEG